MMIAASVAFAPSAVAHTSGGSATPGNWGGHPWPENGCSFSPDGVPGIYSFRHACAHHDGCYIGFPRNGTPTYWTSRLQCDNWFLSDMTASCNWQHGWAAVTYWGRGCLAAAAAYYGSVRGGGWYWYKGPWRN